MAEKATSEQENILEEANRIIHGARNEAYGHPMDDFSKTAKMWEAVLSKVIKPDAQITPEMIALCMVCVKISRLGNTPDHRDSVVDIAGYAGTYEMVMNERARRNAEFIPASEEITSTTITSKNQGLSVSNSSDLMGGER